LYTLGAGMLALLLIAHGSRRAEANADLDYVAEQFRHRGRYGCVQTSFLELTEPSIPQGAAACVAAGATAITMLPYFLSPGVHVREDLQNYLEEFQLQYTNIRFALAEPLGRHPSLIDIADERARNAEASSEPPA
jgi:sirohydrochlorin ferrochelatase